MSHIITYKDFLLENTYHEKAINHPLYAEAMEFINSIKPNPIELFETIDDIFAKYDDGNDIKIKMLLGYFRGNKFNSFYEYSDGKGMFAWQYRMSFEELFEKIKRNHKSLISTYFISSKILGKDKLTTPERFIISNKINKSCKEIFIKLNKKYDIRDTYVSSLFISGEQNGYKFSTIENDSLCCSKNVKFKIKER